MQRKTWALPLLALALTGSVAAPTAHADMFTLPAEGGLSIVLTTSNAVATDTATGGFDVASTTRDRETSELALTAAPHSTSTFEAELREKYALLTNPIAVKAPFAVAGVTWDSSDTLPIGSDVEIRMLEGGEWTPWYSLEVLETPEGVKTTRTGTEYVVTGSSTGVQVRVTKGAGALPASLEIDIAYSDDGTTRTDTKPELTDFLPESSTLTDDAVTGSAEQADSLISELALSTTSSSTPGTHSSGDTATPRPSPTASNDSTSDDSSSTFLLDTDASIQPRSAWGANEHLMTWWYSDHSANYADFEGVIIHHTAGSNTYTKAQVPAVIAAIYYYHARTNGWGDIGYNVLIDKFGGRWEGRYGTLDSSAGEMVIGGHARPRNTGTMGVSVLGDYTDITPSETVLNSLAEVSAWQFLKSDIDPETDSPLLFPSTTSTLSEYYSDIGMPMPRIVGHRDVAATTCPASIEDYMEDIRQRTAELYTTQHEEHWSFIDVPKSHTFHSDIVWMADSGYATGWPDGTFRPQESVTREAFIRFIYRMAGEPAVALPAASPFDDVEPDAPYYTAIVWAHKKGLAKGYSDGTFRPQESIQRDAVAAFLYRYAKSPRFTNTSELSDISESEHRTAIRWLATMGITTGWPDGTFRPSLETTREATAAFLHRYATRN